MEYKQWESLPSRVGEKADESRLARAVPKVVLVVFKKAFKTSNEAFFKRTIVFNIPIFPLKQAFKKDRNPSKKGLVRR